MNTVPTWPFDERLIDLDGDDAGYLWHAQLHEPLRAWLYMPPPTGWLPGQTVPLDWAGGTIQARLIEMQEDNAVEERWLIEIDDA